MLTPAAVDAKLRGLLGDQHHFKAKTEGVKLKAQAQPTRAHLPLLEWNLKYRVNLAPERKFVAHSHLASLYEDDCQEMVIFKAAQLGASEFLISWILWAADMQNATGLYVFPTDTHVSDFSAARLGPAIERDVSPYLAGIIVGGAAAGAGQNGADRVGLKRVHNRFIYFRGAKVSPDGRAPQLRSIDADALVLDEFDEMDVRAAPIARQRLAASKYARQRLASTPTYAEVGIHAEYLNSDRRQWHIPCLACGKLQAPTLDDLVLEWDGLQRPIKWNVETNGAAFLKCKACGGVLDRESGHGEWVAEFPSRSVHGYHLFRLSLPTHIGNKSLGTLLDELNTTDETKRQQAFNQGLGLPYTPSSAQQITNTILDNSRRDYALGETASREPCYAGIDVGRVLHVIVRARAADGSRPLRYANTVDSFDEAAHVLQQFNVRACVVDALPETRAARGMQMKLPRGRVWLAFYDDGAAAKKEQIGVWDPKEGKVSVDRTRSLDATFALFYDAANGKEGNTLPANARELRDYYAHLKAPKRILREDSKKSQVAAYIESGPDHYAHAENYCLVASTCPLAQSWARGMGN